MKAFLISLVFIMGFCPLNVFGQCIEGNCVNGEGTFVSRDGAKYIGQFKGKRYHGRGTFTAPDGRRYIGEFKDGQFVGR